MPGCRATEDGAWQDLVEAAAAFLPDFADAILLAAPAAVAALERLRGAQKAAAEAELEPEPEPEPEPKPPAGGSAVCDAADAVGAAAKGGGPAAEDGREELSPAAQFCRESFPLVRPAELQKLLRQHGGEVDDQVPVDEGGRFILRCHFLNLK
jgi:hypothetical protein